MLHYEKKAREQERIFFKKLKEGTYFQTGKGNQNFIVEITNDAIYVKTKKSKQPFRVSRENIRKALAFLYYRRTTTRKELEPYSKFSSCLMGLLRLMVFAIAKLHKTARGRLRITLNGTRYWIAGGEKAPRDLERAKEYGANYILLSYFKLREDVHDTWKYHIRRLGYEGRVILDSGEFSRYKALKKGKKVSELQVEEYVAFIRKHQDVLFGWFNLDVTNNVDASRKNEQYLISQGLSPIPIWHIQSSWDDLDKLVARNDEFPMIGIGGSVFVSEKERDEKFNKLFSRYPTENFHFLGGASELLFKYPWASADSKFPLVGARFGRLITPAGQIKAPDKWSEEECQAFNIMQVIKLEDAHERVFQLDFLVPPMIKNQQLSLF
ncbi:hypothetical protein AM501_24065 [Aneurinibacillus migulanus]|uniref:hypothetical protein n=1 Tax=Aneurinibacillus migulanus TaxID=47500 RepID=UPI0005BCB5B6|nr:hypothetical protein [Aneurinibacillus migulanus]KIV58915.1 hypothetical protein TS64_03915 [Aneurinibacillus migulanus]KPD05853.1 hypothetical protein AM501_24065 [Aneurinibacillus migulanus]CEH28286.1 Uncharacterized protein BN1090_A2_00704 [Aneurinibacillus migulanus]